MSGDFDLDLLALDGRAQGLAYRPSLRTWPDGCRPTRACRGDSAILPRCPVAVGRWPREKLGSAV